MVADDVDLMIYSRFEHLRPTRPDRQRPFVENVRGDRRSKSTTILSLTIEQDLCQPYDCDANSAVGISAENDA